jgi:hypothetical protein
MIGMSTLTLDVLAISKLALGDTGDAHIQNTVLADRTVLIDRGETLVVHWAHVYKLEGLWAVRSCDVLGAHFEVATFLGFLLLRSLSLTNNSCKRPANFSFSNIALRADRPDERFAIASILCATDLLGH